MRVTRASAVPAALEALGYSEKTWDHPWFLPRGHTTAAERMPSAHLEPGEPADWPYGDQLDPSEIQVTDPLTESRMSLTALLRTRLRSDGLMVVRDGQVRLEWYGDGFTANTPHLVHSCTKTLTAQLVAIAVHEGRISLDAPIAQYVDELAAIAAWDRVTVQHVLDMATGLDTEEHYENADSMYWRYADAVGDYGPPTTDLQGGLEFVLAELTVSACEPGHVFNYASYVTNLLPIAVERAYAEPFCSLLETRIHQRNGSAAEAVMNLDPRGRPISEGQLSLTLPDFARWSLPYVNDGIALNGERILPSEWVRSTFESSAQRRSAFERSEYADAFPGAEYHDQAWLISPQEPVACMLGIHGQFAYLDPSRHLLIVGQSSFPDQANGLLVATMREIWSSLTQAIN
jgi:CubicO group peptidase (beta-lactamase class C family)